MYNCMHFFESVLWSTFIFVILLLDNCVQSQLGYDRTVFQLGIFLRALRPARTGLRPARFTSALPELYFFVNYNFFVFHLQNVIAAVFSDSRCRNACACRFVPMFSSIAYKIVPRPRFVRVLDCDRILVVHA